MTRITAMTGFARIFLLAALLGLSLAAQAATTPGAGSLLQQIAPSIPPAPSSGNTGLKVEQPKESKPPVSTAFEVKSIRITGNTLFDTATLHALVADGEGKKLNLEQLQSLAARITNYYRSHGYPLARAIIPAQTISDGVLTIEVLEARYGKVSLDNHSLVNGGLLDKTLAPLKSGQAISQPELDHALLLLSDIPGVNVNATLVPGEAVGTSDLDVQTLAGPSLGGSVNLDNYGNFYTGRARASGSVNIFNPLHYGDVLSANVITSGSGMDYGRLSYDALLDGQGTRAGGSYSSMTYTLGDSLSSLDAHGKASVTSLWIRRPYVRDRDANLYAQLEYDRKILSDHIDTATIYTDRHLENWVLSLNGDQRDAIFSGGANTWNLGMTFGRVGFDDATAGSTDASSAQTQGNFIKTNWSLSRLQGLTAEDGLYAALAGQWSNKNLDPAEKMIAGGPYTVRAYDMGALSADTGYMGSMEFRHNLGWLGGQWVLLPFIDSAHVTINQNPWATGSNSATLSGAGIGLNWTGINQWHAKTYVAARLGTVPDLIASSSSWRSWIEVGKGF